MTVIDLGKRLRERMAGQTQEEMAARLGITQGTLSRVLRGERIPGPKIARAIVREFPELRDAVMDALLNAPIGSAA